MLYKNLHIASTLENWSIYYQKKTENHSIYMSHLFYDDKQRKHSSNLLSEVNIHKYI